MSSRQALRDWLTAGITYCASRGYMCCKRIDDIQKAFSSKCSREKQSCLRCDRTFDRYTSLRCKHLFSNVTDEKVQCPNDKNQNIYRLVRFQIGAELYCLLTNRFDLTTFQIICIVALRWQIELLFRFLKRTMNGIHLIKNDHRGVTIQFYATLITAILLLHLLKDILEEIENRETQNEAPVNVSIPSIKIEEIEKNQETHAGLSTLNLEASHYDEIPSAYHFLNVLGEKTKKYWKISIHWLKALICLLAEPFDERAIEILGEL